MILDISSLVLQINPQLFLLQVLINFSIYLIIVVSLNLEVGYSGIPQFGRMLAVLAGAIVAGGVTGRILAFVFGLPYGAEYAYDYAIATTITTKYLQHNPLLSIGVLLMTLALAAIIGGIVGYLTSYPALRLKEAYLGITLLAFGDSLMLFSRNYRDLVGGTYGVMVPDVFRWLPDRYTGAVVISLGIAILVFLYVEALTRSPFVRALKAMRDSELASGVYGKDIARLRGQALIIGSALAAVAGALYSFYSAAMDPRAFTRLTWTFWPWAFMMLGGTGNNLGMLVGVFIFIFIRNLIFANKAYISAVLFIDPVWLEYILVGLAIILITLFRPQGILPEKPVLTIKREKIEELRGRLKSSS